MVRWRDIRVRFARGVPRLTHSKMPKKSEALTTGDSRILEAIPPARVFAQLQGTERATEMPRTSLGYGPPTAV